MIIYCFILASGHHLLSPNMKAMDKGTNWAECLLNYQLRSGCLCALPRLVLNLHLCYRWENWATWNLCDWVKICSLQAADLRLTFTCVCSRTCAFSLYQNQEGFCFCLALFEQTYQNLFNKISSALPCMKISASKDVEGSNEMNLKGPEVPEQGTHSMGPVP